MKKTFLQLAVLLCSIFCSSVEAGWGGVPAGPTVSTLSVPEQYPTIQEAIDAAPGSAAIVQIAAGDYYEQLLISNKTITLAGEPGTVLHATAGLTQTLDEWTPARPVVGIVRSHVTLVGLTIDGHRLGNRFSSGAFQGVVFLSSRGGIEDCTLRGFRGGSLTDYSSARSLVVWNPESVIRDSVEVNISSSRFEDNEASIVLAGDDEFNPTLLRTSFIIEGNTIAGFGAAPLALDGIAIYTGAGGTIRGNTITNFQYTGEGDPYASGITAFDGLGNSRTPLQFIPLQPIRVEENTFRNNDDHLVLLNAPDGVVLNNIFEGPGPGKSRWGALAISGGNIRVENNNFSNTSIGIYLFGNDHFFPGFPTVVPANNATLTANWFSNIPNPVQIPPDLPGPNQQRTQLAPFQPEFQAVSRSVDGFRMRVRAWHDQLLVIESSFGDLVQWGGVQTNSASSPVIEFLDPNPNGVLRVYRARSYAQQIP